VRARKVGTKWIVEKVFPLLKAFPLTPWGLLGTQNGPLRKVFLLTPMGLGYWEQNRPLRKVFPLAPITIGLIGTKWPVEKSVPARPITIGLIGTKWTVEKSVPAHGHAHPMGIQWRSRSERSERMKMGVLVLSVELVKWDGDENGAMVLVCNISLVIILFLSSK